MVEPEIAKKLVVIASQSDMLPSNLGTTPWLPAPVFLSYLLIDYCAQWADNSYSRPVHHDVNLVICDLC